MSKLDKKTIKLFQKIDTVHGLCEENNISTVELDI
jgi:hypothetical protein